MYVTEEYKPKRSTSKNTRFGTEKDTQISMTERAKSQSLEFFQFLKELSPEQQKAVNEALRRINDYVSGAGHKRIFGIIIPEAVESLEKNLSKSSE